MNNIKIKKQELVKSSLDNSTKPSTNLEFNSIALDSSVSSNSSDNTSLIKTRHIVNHETLPTIKQ